ncbi:MAG: signal peptide peptidase SppA [Candidatus Caenarcaniphilales bacterium]|nr:signal peptide peptidase SppA [Candidatus Caenarcaniphilales bacterium]
MTKERIFAIVLIILALTGIVLSFLPSNKSKSSKSSFDLYKALPVGAVSGDKILSLSLNGVIVDGETQSVLGNETSEAVKVRQELSKLLKDYKENKVKGLLIRINSPGGTVGISQEIYHLVREIRKKMPVVISMGDLAASGGYYIASAGDVIYANPGTLTGSIGVIAQGFIFKGLMDKLGVQDNTFKAGKYKDIASFTRSMTDEEKAILQELLDDTYDQFVTDVYEGRRSEKYSSIRRKMTKEYVQSIAKGLIYTGRQALKYGLVDELGGYDQALDTLQSLVKERSEGKIKDDLKVIYTVRSAESLKDILNLNINYQQPQPQIGFAGLIQSLPGRLWLLAPELISNNLY